MVCLRNAVFVVFAIATVGAAQSRDTHAAYNAQGEMIAYSDSATGITLNISDCRTRITAVDGNRRKLWSRNDYFEETVDPFKQTLLSRPVPHARISHFMALAEGEHEHARKLGFRDPVMRVYYSSRIAGGAQGLISETDGKLVNDGDN
jgi:hypothetical protein